MPDKTLKFRFEGADQTCCVGDTIAAALTAAGERWWRLAADGSRRGIFCGMGVCQDCLVRVDGRAGVRACMTPVEAGMDVRRQTGPAALAPSAASAETDQPPPVRTSQIVVVGGGPAGLMAAAAAAESGAAVVLIDERPAPGGQYYKQPHSTRPAARGLADDRQIADGRRLIDRAMRAGVELVASATVWGGFPGPRLAVAGTGGTTYYEPERLIVATGAYERGMPVPGWTLPGVMTTGAAQTLLRSHAVTPGERVLVAGNGPLNLQVALELADAGVDVAMLAEAARVLGPRAPRGFLRLLAAAPGLAVRGARMTARLRGQGVPIRYGWRVASIEECPDGLEVRLGPATGGRIEARATLRVDAVCMGYGFLPNNELLRQLGCRHDYDAGRGCLVTERDERCQTSLEGTYAIGDCTGLRGAPTALEEGVIAGLAAARSLGVAIPPGLVNAERRARQRIRRHARFQAALWALYAAAPSDAARADGDAVVCRCENVTAAGVNAAVEAGCGSPGELKQRTRLGMGACQGRYCVPVALDTLAGRSGLPPGEYSALAPQSPLKPVTIAQILGAGTEGPAGPGAR